MQKFLPGQRWVSDTEPELGLGAILEVGPRDLKISFPAAGVVRTYMHRNAPLRRARLKPGDKVRLPSGHVFSVRAVEEREGLLVYRGDGDELPESALPGRMGFGDPDARLLAGHWGKPKDFDLRLRTLAFRREMLASPVRGLAGARMELLEHQLYIAAEVAGRPRPRVLLADEVGLGKTIEAGLVFHRLYVTGQVSRVLVVAPSQLVHQWLVELYRRFNHMFTVVDEDLCRSEEKGDKAVNPFLGRQTMICAIDFLAASPRRAAQAAEAGLDLLIVDEAHHLSWSPGAPSPEYRAVEALARAAPAVLLLTATPVQLGQVGHFGRLRLLDPARFSDLDAYLAETGFYRDLAALVDRALAREAPDAEAAEALRAAFPGDAALAAKLAGYLAGEAGARDGLIEHLVDRHGTGRLMFRNRRAVMPGFPPRVVEPAPLPPGPEHREFTAAVRGALGGLERGEELARYLGGAAAFTAEEAKVEGGHSAAADFLRRAWRKDPRLDWLADLLKEVRGEKVLLLCAHKSVVFALQEILPTLTTAPFTAFHENMTMATRDKNAAYFARHDGAQLLICSEIGSEGRNFQFAHHLVLFDLPLDPSVLEQRIGRLDRIGQRREIRIHVPYLAGTAHEVLYRWYAEGLEAFRAPLFGSDFFYGEQAEAVRRVCRLAVEAGISGAGPGAFAGALDELVAQARALSLRVRDTLEKGRDRLLELNSWRPGKAREIAAAIREADDDPDLENYLERVFDHFGVDTDSTAVARGYFIFPGPQMFIDTFPGLPEEGLAATFDREEAAQREELAFLTPDHPLVRSAVDLVLGSAEGTVACVEWKDAPLRGMALEAVYVLEAAAPGALHIDRFLAPAPVRVVVDQVGREMPGLRADLDRAHLEQADTAALMARRDALEALLPGLLEAAKSGAEAAAATLRGGALREARTVLGRELARLRELRAVNPSVSAAEVDVAEKQMAATLAEIEAAELRLDALRLIILGQAGRR